MGLKKLFNFGDLKTKIIIKNAGASVLIKGVNILVSFLTIPLVLSFFDTTQYGVWLTLTAFLSWFTLFDLGFGNGLRNHLATAIANNNQQEARIYISTTYTSLAVFFGVLMIIFIGVHRFINWNIIFNAPASMEKDITGAILFSVCLLFTQFVFKLITTVLLSFQKAAMADVCITLGQVLILAGIYGLKQFHFNSLKSTSIIYSLTPALTYLAFSIYFFSRKYSSYSPSLKYFKLGYIKKIMNLGLNFFVIQIAALVLYTSDNFMITQFFSPSDVTLYNISFKYFSITSLLFTIILTPFWSMATKAYAEGDITWIRKTMNKLLILWVLAVLLSSLQLMLSNDFYKFWTADKVQIPIKLSIVVCIYSLSVTLGSIFSSFLNGIGKVRLQLYVAIVAMMINIPLAIFLIKVVNVGVIGIPLATTIVVLAANCITATQFKKISSGKRITSFWNN